MLNNYDSPQITEIGKAQDVILGAKPIEHPYDSVDDQRQQPLTDEDE